MRAENDFLTMVRAHRHCLQLEEMGQNTPEHHALVVPTARQILEKELAHSKGTHEVLLRAYRRFLSKLQMPESATLVQGMRGFVRSLRDSSQASVAKSLQSYFDSTMAMLKSHPAFSSEPDFDMVQRSLQSFVYGHGKDSVWLTIDTKQDEVNFKRWQALQFVTPEHLDIPCLIGKSPADLDFLLKDSISALNLLELFFSPYEKLQCILKAYHGINAALSVALNRKAGSKKLPSADDILPTLILSVLRAKPKAVVSNLAMIETFSPPEHLRGEAGYAYTNLYGAIQFLLDLDLDKDPEKLTISSQDFRNGLDTCRAAAESKLSRREIQADREMQPLAQLEDLTIPVSVIRSARLAGVTTNVHWAKQWYEENGRVTTITGELSEPEVLPDILPSGFTRSYSFLTTRPDEVRVSDLPHLLAEYRMLVHTTEVLLAERSSRQSVERKRRFASEQKRLEEEALELELHLELKTNK